MELFNIFVFFDLHECLFRYVHLEGYLFKIIELPNIFWQTVISFNLIITEEMSS